MIIRFLFITAIFFATQRSYAQYENKVLQAVRCVEAPKLDGSLNEAVWLNAPVAAGFVMQSPTPGVPLPQNTEVKIIYDDEAIYVGFMNFDTAPDSILKQLSGRDGDGNSDYCGITFSCYQDGINGLSFFVTPTSEQWDARITNGEDEDTSWNAIWDCRTSITPEGWIAEFKIPFAAIRFPDQPEQVWDINFAREIRRTREKGFWRGVDPAVQGFVTQMGQLIGIKDVKAPTRIFFTPYASAYYNVVQQADAPTRHETSWNAGMDVKIGLNDAFTLDATLIPDFGQVISDQQILNLTPFEVQFQDNRQFFIEGTELFSKANLFYSRRVGYLPDGYFPDIPLADEERITRLPQQLQLLNASKISGRNSKGLGIGFFNGVSAKTNATVTNENGETREVEIYPLTNYNVTVLDQNLRNNSYISIINTNVLRNGEYYDANVSGLEFDLRNKKGSYSISGSGAYNRKFGGEYREVRRDREGFTQNVNFEKISGNFRFGTGASTESDTYDPTDMGFLQANNSMNYYAWTSYNIFKPFWKLNNLSTTFSFSYNQLYKPNVFTDMMFDWETFINTKKFTTYYFNISAGPVRGMDYFEPRTDGMKFVIYSWQYAGGWISTDYRKPLAIDAGGGIATFENEGRYEWDVRFSPRMRFSDKLFVVYRYQLTNHDGDLGFANRADDGRPIFGKRKVVSHTNTLTVNYSFNPLMTVLCRVRHYWGYSKYSEFYDLDENGLLLPTDFQGFVNEFGESISHSNSDRNFNTFTIDLIYRWIFVPGSEVNIVWKNDITKGEFGVPIPRSLREDFDYTLGLPQTNNFSIRVLYFLDYHQLKPKKIKG
ncbi:MAG: DUF5916 domain-containing protein [Flavobacteriales bacterium]